MPMQERKLAVLVYGFPPGVGATGTAALLNVPKSLEHVLATLQQVGRAGLRQRPMASCQSRLYWLAGEHIAGGPTQGCCHGQALSSCWARHEAVPV